MAAGWGSVSHDPDYGGGGFPGLFQTVMTEMLATAGRAWTMGPLLTVGAIEAIHRRLIELRDAGKAILLVSVELDEIRALSDRILVMFDGRVMGELSGDAGEREIGLLMSGVEQEDAA